MTSFVTITDPIYGEFNISEPVLMELIKAPSVLRLKKISQYGVPDQFYWYPGYSRYEHSVGVMLLLGKLGASLEEQVAGLLHDVSHLAFSHTADLIFADGGSNEEDYHDKIKHHFVARNEIGQILRDHDLDIARVSNEKNFGLLEQEIPALCVDRFDYAIRQFQYYKDATIVAPSLKALEVVDKRLVFTDLETALKFAHCFLELQTGHWGDARSTAIVQLLSNVLRMGLAGGVINKSDFLKDDELILEKLEKDRSVGIRQGLKLLREGRTENFPSVGKKIFKKFRYLDPLVVVGIKLEKLSDISAEFTESLAYHRAINEEGIVA